MKWCDNKMQTGPFYVLVLNVAEYHKAMRRIRRLPRSVWRHGRKSYRARK